MVNHYENHWLITTKDNLFKNLVQYLKHDVYNIVPLTFCIESYSKDYKQDLEKFKIVFDIIQQYSNKNFNKENADDIIDQINLELHEVCINYKTLRMKSLIKVYLENTHFDGYNLWFLKVTQYNRGRGIYIFRTFEELERLIVQLRKGIVYNNEDPDFFIDNETKTATNSIFTKKFSYSSSKIKSSTFVIQKYVEKPMLINNRKFDIRVWVLLTHNAKVYFCNEGYIRTSSETYSLGKHLACLKLSN